MQGSGCPPSQAPHPPCPFPPCPTTVWITLPAAFPDVEETPHHRATCARLNTGHRAVFLFDINTGFSTCMPHWHTAQSGPTPARVASLLHPSLRLDLQFLHSPLENVAMSIPSPPPEPQSLTKHADLLRQFGRQSPPSFGFTSPSSRTATCGIVAQMPSPSKPGCVRHRSRHRTSKSARAGLGSQYQGHRVM
jgi:hypothetical protein